MLLLPPEGGNLAVQDLDRLPLGRNRDGRPRSRTATPADPAGAALRRDLADRAAIWPTATARHCGRFHVTAGTTAGVSVIEPTGQQAITESDCRPTAFLVKTTPIADYARLVEGSGWTAATRRLADSAHMEGYRKLTRAGFRGSQSNCY